MRPFRSALLGLVLAACGDSNSPRPDPNRYVGTWDVSVSQSVNCWPAFTLQFTITPDNASGALDHAINVVSEWWFPSTPANKQLVTGNIDWQANTFTLVFNRGGRTARLEGTGSSPTATLTGVLTDANSTFVTDPDCGLVANAQATVRKE